MNNNYFKIYSLSILILLIGYSIPVSSQSVLSTGRWYQIAIEKDGIYKLSLQDFVSMGFDIENIDPNKIQIFGNVKGVLPEANNILVPEALKENPIFVSGADDNSFDDGDYVVFYAEGAHKWVYERFLERFTYKSHPYADKNYYYITVNQDNGKRIAYQNSLNDTPYKVINNFIDYKKHESNLVNFVKSGRNWYGESFENTDVINLPFTFENLDVEKKVKYGLYLAARATVYSTLIVHTNDSHNNEVDLPKLQSTGGNTWAKEKTERSFFFHDNDFINFELQYDKPNASANVWLDYIEVNAYRHLKMTEDQLKFSYDVLLDENKIFEFKLQNANENTIIWDISDPYDIKQLKNMDLNNDLLSFSLLLNETHFFAAFDDNKCFQPELVGEIANQDLKALEPFDMAIITVDDFWTEAGLLASFHQVHDTLRTIVINPQQIYNEFSSGKQDPTAIRNFLRYHYNKNDDDSEKPKYLLLFGDASYDYKDVLPENTNLVPTFQSVGSLSHTATFDTDDYFGILGQQDGDSAKGEIQISIGRFPVHTIEQATTMVDKTIRYAVGNNEDQMSSWRNNVCFIADDGNNNLHLDDSNTLADTFLLDHPEFNVDKIFFDSYVKINTPNGKRYPDVTEAINRSVEEGVLFVNYTGHGGPVALSEERVLTIPDIQAWRNIDNLSVFIVASCEFGPFDDPHHISAGEHIVLNPLGGGIALFTTTRLAYASYNFKLNKKFHEIAFSRDENGNHYRLGEIIKYAKNESGNLQRNFNFCLLGDPALKMAYPECYVETTHINNQEIGEAYQDTLKAQQTVNVKGIVTDIQHQLLQNFNGIVEISVYGKPTVYTTLANDAGNHKTDFEIIDLVIYNGKARANNGEFEFSFVVPSGMNTIYGPGKISYYATDSNNETGICDANGGYLEFIVGGIDHSVENDNQGPDIDIHLDNYQFKDGDATSTHPMMLVDLFDINGINNVQFGFGREITAKIDHENSINLNESYSYEENSHQKGKVEFQLNDLDLGTHNLLIKAWDMFDNSNEKSINFIVTNAGSLNIFNLKNTPNPMANHTRFSFEHNQPDEISFDVNIHIYDIQGKKIWSYQCEAYVNGNTIEPIHMNTSQISSPFLKQGLYTYVLDVKNKKGQTVQQSQKLIVVK